MYFKLPVSLQEKQEEQLLTSLPPPTPLQIQAIGMAIEKVVQEFGINNEDLEQRLGIKSAMENVLHQKLPGNNNLSSSLIDRNIISLSAEFLY